MQDKLRFFGLSLAVTAVALAGSLLKLGWEAALVMVVLVLVEVTFSFENAVINAKVLRTLAPRWQAMFLTFGILIAIFGMRVVFPIAIVALTAGLPWHTVVDLALHDPSLYAIKLAAAHHTIAAFGGSFLLMLFLHFFFDRQKQVHWLERLERPLQRLGHWWLPSSVSVLLVVAAGLAPANHHGHQTIIAGLLGIAVFLAVRGVDQLFARLKTASERGGASVGAGSGRAVQQTGWAAFVTFLYLEILDASFSFDGVIGAFAITKSVVLIAIGLGVGAFWVRSLTVYMVRRGTLDKYRYLEHGAHYTVGVLAVTLLLSLFVDVPEAVAGLAGVVLVGAAFLSGRPSRPPGDAVASRRS